MAKLPEMVSLTLEQVKRKFDRNQIDKALGFAKKCLLFINRANETELFRQISLLIQKLESGSVEEAKQILSRLLPESETITGQVMREIRAETPHRHIVKEINCPFCRKLIPENSNFCPFCVKEIVRIDCPNCHKKILQAWKACPFCGRKIN